jgi:hypothetical protein
VRFNGSFPDYYWAKWIIIGRNELLLGEMNYYWAKLIIIGRN